MNLTDTFSPALHELATTPALAGPALLQLLREVVRQWVAEAIEATPKGSRERMLRYFQQQIRGGRSRRGAGADAWRGTLAEAIVAKLQKAHGRNARDVGAWVAGKLAAVNLHRAGFTPARVALRVPPGSAPIPNLKSPPGDYREHATNEVAEFLVENWAAAGGQKAKGIEALAPGALERPAAGLAEKAFDAVMSALMGGVRQSGLLNAPIQK